MAPLEALKAENQRLKEAQTSGISFKVSEKGALSLYGLGRFPVTLHRSQWERLAIGELSKRPEIIARAAADVAKFKTSVRNRRR